MNADFTQKVLLPSLELIKTDFRIKRFYFFPGILSVIFLSVLLVYQVVYTYVVLLKKTDTLMKYIYEVFHSNYFFEILLFSVCFTLIYIIIMPIFEGALIRYIQQKQHGNESRSEAFGYGIVRFYAMFEFNNVFNMFKLMSIFNAYLFSLRFLGLEYISILSIFFTLAFFLSIILNIFIAYTQYEIVLENKSVFESLSVSAQIALLNLKLTFQLYIFMIFMNIRVVINFFIFLFFPLAVLSVGSFLSSVIFTTIAYTILGILFIFFTIVLGYLTSVLDIFTTSVWYHAYKLGREKIHDVH